ncbi:DUF6894 family protein [uncultured Devosia sp.]|uniref:DUF6894 family protein n=1 Tax=uncultured Devosia sp. TaxID=211434 RepID=UPI0035CAC17B
MPRFFFNLRSPQGHQMDIDGLKLGSLNEALDEASFAAQAAVAMADADGVQGVFEIEDEGRMLLARVPYSAEARPKQTATESDISVAAAASGPSKL